MHPRHLVFLSGLLRNQWRSAAALEAVQSRRLRALVRHAWERVPWYRRLFEATGLHPADIRTARDLAALPVTTREMLQSLPLRDRLAAGIDPDRCIRITTSGSSGAPLEVVVRPDELRYNDMAWTRASLAAGRRLYDRVVYFKFFFPSRRWFERLGIWRRLLLSLADSPAENLARLRALRPAAIRGNPLTLRELAWEARRLGVDDIRLRRIYTMGSLLDPDARRLLEEVFHGVVFDAYGATEIGCIAWECPRHTGYHLSIDTAVVQLENNGQPCRPGEAGRVIATHLGAHTMPFIRYDLGDIATAGDTPCPCGRGLPLLKHLDGRADDFLLRPDGSLLSPGLLVNRLKTVPGLRQYRITQEHPLRLDCLVLRHPDAGADCLDTFRRVLSELTGPALELEIRPVDRLPPDASGKIRALCNRLRSPAATGLTD